MCVWGGGGGGCEEKPMADLNQVFIPNSVLVQNQYTQDTAMAMVCGNNVHGKQTVGNSNSKLHVQATQYLPYQHTVKHV